MNATLLRAPFPWFGGKSRASELVWRALGDVPNYVEPFAGSLAVLLGRTTEPKVETVNDLDAFIANVWRAIQADPEQVAHHADWPVSEVDLHARHQWLVKQVTDGGLRERLMTDPDLYDAKIAGWWIWGICQWIGGGWCRIPGEHERGTAKVWQSRPAQAQAMGVHKRRPVLGRGGRGVTRKLPDVHNAGIGVHSALSRQLPDLSGDSGASGRGVHASARSPLLDWMTELSARMRRVRVCCGDWSRVLTKSPTTAIGMTGVLLDPPYADTAKRTKGLYAQDSLSVAHDVRKWAIANAVNPLFRIVLCGYEGEHDMPEGWTVVEWSAAGGYGGGKSRHRERLWLSPHCIKADFGPLFGGAR